MNCGCQFNLPSTYGYCQSAFVGNIVEGHFGDTSLAGLNWAGLYKWPGEIAAGNGQRQIVIDERADDAQRIALETIISGEACAHLSNCFSVFVSACSEFCETLFLPIDLDANFELRTARVDIPGVMKSSGKPIINERGNRARHDIGDRWYRDGVRGFMGALLCLPLQSGWVDPRVIDGSLILGFKSPAQATVVWVSAISSQGGYI